MSATDYAAHLTQITHLRVFNCYLVREDDGLTLVDTGPARAAAQILQQIDRIGLPLRRIVLTHAHSDHVAGLDQIACATGDGVEIVVGRRESAILAGDLAPRASEPATTSRSRSYGSPRTKPPRLVDDQQQVGSLASAKRLLGEQPARLATGHGPVLDNPVPALLRAIARIATSDPPYPRSATAPVGVAGMTSESNPPQE